MNAPPTRNPLLPDSAFDVVTIAASAGGIKALTQLLPGLPATFPVAIIIIMHISPDSPSLLADILSRCTPLSVRQARNGDTLQADTIYTASPDYHLLVKANKTLYLTHTDRVNFARPAADCTLQSVAEQFGHRLQ
jgi:two-component system chemotaxis response regulator CheB